MNKRELNIRLKELTDILIEQYNKDGYWEGKLSSSALGVAVSISALHFHNATENQQEIKNGLEWLVNNINDDGSYGDTPNSPGNISTSLLAYSALNLYSIENKDYKLTQNKISEYLLVNSIDLKSGHVSKVILAHYKSDFTFSVPILSMCALCDVLGDDGFKDIPSLPFEFALLPQKFYRLLKLSVVSYAIPALIAVGILIFKKKKQNWFSKTIRQKSEKKALKILEKSMPESGGFLEAIPLTAFVSLSLISSGNQNSIVVNKGIQFLKNTQRDDGSWPIDINLSTWVTTLSIKALRTKTKSALSTAKQRKLTEYLIATQNKNVHPFNGTSPGGWGWTNHTGSVPDCDDTPGAIIALLQLKSPTNVKNEVLLAVNWLIKLQNSDGGFPTFSKGWGKLPFDQSCTDLTGHCFLAIAIALNNYDGEIPRKLHNKMVGSLKRALTFLEKQQNIDGSWFPLWFGNQHTENHTNPVYGTARVISYLNDTIDIIAPEIKLFGKIKQLIQSGTNYLLEAQNKDGSWGGAKNIKGSIEETALAISALSNTDNYTNCESGFSWLNDYFNSNGLQASPIGLYFASLWYDEALYPLTFYIEAIERYINNN